MYNGSSPAVSYGPLGIGSAIYGSGDSDTWSYDAAGHINNIKTAVGSGGQYYQSNVTWNASGTVKQLVTTDTVTGGTHNDVTDAYAYDDMGRVSTATGVSTMAETYTYDRYGNITTSGYPSSWVPGYDTTTNRFTATNCNPGGICYDLDGNLLTDPSHTYTWDAEDKQASIDGHAITRDAFGRAVEELCTTGCTAFQTVYGPGGKVALAIGQTIYTARIPLPGGGNAVYNWTSGTEGLDHYDHPDWLGNARIQTTPAGSLWAQREYTPFGVPYDATACPTGCDLLFNGGSQDTASGEYDTENRELNSVQGRWIQPDPAGLAAVDITNPQTWNRYAYVNNNPLSNVDPTGLDCIYLNDDNSINHVNTGGNADCDSSTDDGYYVDGTIVGGANGVSVSEDGNWLAYTIQGNDFASGMCIGDCGFSTTVSSVFSSTDVVTIQANKTTPDSNCGLQPCGPGIPAPGLTQDYCGFGYHCNGDDIAENCASDAGLAAVGLTDLNFYTWDQITDKVGQLATGPGVRALVGSVLGATGRGIFYKGAGTFFTAKAAYDATKNFYQKFTDCWAKNAPRPH